ncbi:MAG: DUF4838 domain-containing protein, partial [Clostridia bacterium]|nr:DUF4838 domain-containing protein [Clostridia bacterium]
MKKIISVLLCMIMVGSMVVSASALVSNNSKYSIFSDDAFMLGDANGDNAVNAIDNLEIKKYCVSMPGANLKASDINADNVVNAKDLLLLTRCQAGVDSLESYDNANVVDRFTIAGNDISNYCIVYHKDSKYVENAYYAATTLSKYVESATGVSLPIVTEATTEYVIEMVDVTTVPGLEEDLGVENYKYEVVNGNLYIYGTRRGNMYAVYEILEEVLGYRFYAPNELYLYNERVIDIAEGTSVYRDPGTTFRFSGQNMTTDKTGIYFANRLNGSTLYSHDGIEYGTLTGPHWINAHSYGYYWKMATGPVYVDYDGTNSNDYWAKMDAGIQQNELEWNPCFTSDAEYATLFRGLLEVMRLISGWHTFREETSSMSFSICDNANYTCSCNSCKYISSTGTDRKKGERLNCGAAGLNIYLANRACRDVVEYYPGRAASMQENGDKTYSDGGYGGAITDAYPGMNLYTIIYDSTPAHEKLFTDERYKDIIPAENLIIMFCAQVCNNHTLDSGECEGKTNILGRSGLQSAEAMKSWGEACNKSGAELWFWYYAVSYNTFLSDSPNIYNIYYDFKFASEVCHVTGFFYEGGSGGYIFENLKAYLATKYMWSITEDENGNLNAMSIEEFEATMLEYLQMYYGDGAEYIFEYIKMQDHAGNINTTSGDKYGTIESYCYVNNLDYPGDMFDYEYMRDNYEHMRGLILKALALAEGAQVRRCEYLLMNAEFLGLSACHKSWYVEST